MMYRCYPPFPDFVFNMYSSYIENKRRRKRREGTAMRSVFLPDFVNVRMPRVISHERNEENNERRFRSVVDGKRVLRQIARKPRRASPSWNMTALIQGGPSLTLDTTVNVVSRFHPPYPFARPSTSNLPASSDSLQCLSFLTRKSRPVASSSLLAPNNYTGGCA